MLIFSRRSLCVLIFLFSLVAVGVVYGSLALADDEASDNDHRVRSAYSDEYREHHDRSDRDYFFESGSVHRVSDQNFRMGIVAIKNGDLKRGVRFLERAAQDNHVVALWKLGDIYDNPRYQVLDPERAARFFRRLVDVSRSTADKRYNAGPFNRFISNAYVRLALLEIDLNPVLEGSGDLISKDILLKDQFNYMTMAATSFGDPDAQYLIACLNLNSHQDVSDQKRSVAFKWLRKAAIKGHREAQGLLGDILFNGRFDIPQNRVQGLMWLSLSEREPRFWTHQGQDSPLQHFLHTPRVEPLLVSQTITFEDAYILANEDERLAAAAEVRAWKTLRR